MLSTLFGKSRRTDSKNFNVLISTTAFIFIIFISFGLAGCGYHHNDDDSTDSDSGFSQGVFLDSPVQGLHYETASQSGTTDGNGYFHYREGEMILFSMGGIFLGQTLAEDMMTPIDLVPGAMDETHPTVTNMLRFMQTLDWDNNPENGITFPAHILDELEGRPIHFDMDSAEFEHHVDIEMFMDTIHGMDENYAGRKMVSIQDAQEHMRNTMMNMMNGGMPVEDSVSDGGMPGGDEMMNGDTPGENGVTDGGMTGGDGTMNGGTPGENGMTDGGMTGGDGMMNGGMPSEDGMTGGGML